MHCMKGLPSCRSMLAFVTRLKESYAY